ncbi:hypothetical protein [Thauera linaloolentis]|uniref:Uncharacterized protein n=1 Tax=Thauera linaloolentis (strain DSM 12138 / JCM 21573 / CCUG 41526 / CIP 105981 / IAM 15112 / NBRC 102519 / 47Lol) TaxID=1123367 RepID=N6YVZ6_THAL4|nr:hypothetical protein [Thauera linaloolentis]ENO86303.1 hypothetical protein C666_13545 [Thauera linaloolentis 47Lol = DSM 12138]MCM8567528.1 hypothetical protein [Thauera linaloolentis]
MIQAAPAAGDKETDAFQRWLEAEPADEVVDDLDALRGHLAELRRSGVTGSALRQCLEGAAARGLDVSARIRAQLQALSLPLPGALHGASADVSGALIEMAQGLEAMLPEPAMHAQAWERDRRQALALCCEAFIVSAMSAANPPSGLWRLANRMAGGLEDDVSYRTMAAIAAASPESFTARQLAWIADFLDGGLPGVQKLAEGESLVGAWWVDLTEDAAPVSAARRLAPGHGEVRHFSLAPLARVLGERIERLEAVIGGAEDAGGALAEVELLDAGDESLPPGLTPVELLALLRALRERWVTSPLRTQPRRPQHYAVQVCLGLRGLWELGRGRGEAGRVLEWQVLNESPGGYAIMNVVGTDADAAGEIEAGIVLGLRRQAGTAWAVCVVRWVRSDGPERIELGLQVLAPSYHAVQVAFRGATLRGVAPALALPPMEPMRRQPAFLAPAGTYASRRFVFVREGTHLYVAQGRALGLDMQTSSIELFRYEIDPYPI